MEETLDCIRCHREIKPRENFIEITEWNNQKLLLKNRMHKSCWVLTMDENKTKVKALGYLKQVMGKLKDTGMVQDEVRV